MELPGNEDVIQFSFTSWYGQVSVVGSVLIGSCSKRMNVARGTVVANYRSFVYHVYYNTCLNQSIYGSLKMDITKQVVIKLCGYVPNTIESKHHSL